MHSSAYQRTDDCSRRSVLGQEVGADLQVGRRVVDVAHAHAQREDAAARRGAGVRHVDPHRVHVGVLVVQAARLVVAQPANSVRGPCEGFCCVGRFSCLQMEETMGSFFGACMLAP